MEAYKINLYSLGGLNKDIDIRTHLLNKAWRVFNDSDVKETCVFSEDGIITIIKDGVETTTSWKLDSTDNAIVIGENKLYPSYKDNVLFVFNIPEKGYVVLVDEKNVLSIIPTTKQDLYDYFQKVELVYYRFSYPQHSFAYTAWLILNFLFIPAVLLTILLFTAYRGMDMVIKSPFVEIGMDSISYTTALLIYVIIFTIIGWPLQKLHAYVESALNAMMVINSEERWIRKNHDNNRWKQCGYNLFLYCRKHPYYERSLFSPDTFYNLKPNLIGIKDERIESRDQLFKVNKETSSLRNSLCKKTSKKTWGIIFILMTLVSIGIEYAFCQILPPVFNETPEIWTILLLLVLLVSIVVGIWQFMNLFVVPHFEYKRDCYRIKRWIIANSTDWRKDYVMFKNYSDYKEWREL